METHHQNQKHYTENDVENRSDQGISTASSKAKQLPSSPTSPTSSPSHEFSFTISLHSSSNSTILDKSKPPPPSSLALDLSPADDIFFHGHLLPLHLLSHFSSSPRFSTNSVDSFTLPIKDFLEHDQKPTKDSGSLNSSNRSNISIDSLINKEDYYNYNNNIKGTNTKEIEDRSSKHSFSLFGSKGRKGCPNREKEDKEKQKRNLGYDVIHALKKYLRMVQPLVIFRGRREKTRFQGEAFSRSGNLIRRNHNKVSELRRRKGECCSAPVSMKTSPTNSGLLLATAIPPSNNDSTMEELQAAIQAAIAHCKNSIAKEDKLSS